MLADRNVFVCEMCFVVCFYAWTYLHDCTVHFPDLPHQTQDAADLWVHVMCQYVGLGTEG